MKHYSSPREKKVLALGLVALLGLPDAALPPEVRPGMPQVRGAGAAGRGLHVCRAAAACYCCRAAGVC